MRLFFLLGHLLIVHAMWGAEAKLGALPARQGLLLNGGRRRLYKGKGKGIVIVFHGTTIPNLLNGSKGEEKGDGERFLVFELEDRARG